MSGDITEEMDIEAFSRWDVEALCAFLEKRRLKVTGNKATLVARAFVAWEQGTSAQPRLEEKQTQTGQQYEDLLSTADEGTLPDPLTGRIDWLGEEGGMRLWPPIMLRDISEYLQRHDNHAETASMRARLLKDYENSKALRHLSSKWLFEIKFAKISEKYLFLSSKFRPSQGENNKPQEHDLWVCSTDEGRIVSAYCTCFAGQPYQNPTSGTPNIHMSRAVNCLDQSCQHIAALLLKVDFSWRHGLNSKIGSSNPSVWNVGEGVETVEPKRVCDIEWTKPGAQKKGAKKGTNAWFRKSKSCKPLSTSNKSGMKLNLEEFLDKLAVISPNSVILTVRSARPSSNTTASCQSDTSLTIKEKPIESVSQRATEATEASNVN